MWFFKNILDKILWSNTLYYPWCLTKSLLPDIEKNYEDILHKLWIDFIKLSEKEYCCWSPVLRAGMKDAFENIKNKNIEIFKEHAVGLIITNCPACYNMLKYQYKLEEEHGIKVEHITQTIKRKSSKLKKSDRLVKEITYHDPCHLWRLSWVYEEPRDILKQNWYNIKELKNNRENSICCWWGGWLVNNNPELSEKICNDVLEQVENKKLTSPCPMCYFQFKKHAKEIEVKEFSEIILEENN